MLQMAKIIANKLPYTLKDCLSYKLIAIIAKFGTNCLCMFKFEFNGKIIIHVHVEAYASRI